jgi:hypothetical protein
VLKNLFIIILLTAIAGCKPRVANSYNTYLSNLLKHNSGLKKSLTRVFEINDTTHKCFKTVISRRERFIRVTIYQLINREELNEPASTFFTYGTNTFICYDGSELLYGNRIENNLIEQLKLHLRSGVINDSRVFQFDIDSRSKTLRINTPAINPYDFYEKKVVDTALFKAR